MSQAAADVLDGINKINDILKPYFTNAGETMRNDIENAANEIQNAVNYANNAINGIKSIFTYLNAQSDIRFTRLSDDFDTHRNELYAEIKNISSGLSKFNDDMSSQSDVVNKDFQDINDKINEILDLMLDKIEAYMKLDVEPLYNDVSDEEIDEQTTGRVDGCNNVGMYRRISMSAVLQEPWLLTAMTLKIMQQAGRIYLSEAAIWQNA